MNKKESDQIKKRIAIYNMIPNILWSVIFLSPISVFCYSNMTMKTFFIFLAVSLLILFLPKNNFIFSISKNNIPLQKDRSWIYK